MNSNENEPISTVFEIKTVPHFFKRIYQEFILIFSFNLGLVIGAPEFFSGNWLLIESIILFFILVKVLRKRNRQIYKLTFNGGTQSLEIEYFYFAKLKANITIPYSTLEFTYKHKLYGRGKIPLTLEIFNQRKFCAEIRHKYNLGWKDNEIENIKNAIIKVAIQKVI